MDRNSNLYTILFSVIIVTISTLLLVLAVVLLKPYQEKNIRQEKMADILYTIGLDKDALAAKAAKDGNKLNYEQIEKYFNLYCKEQLTLKYDGSIDKNVKAFDVNLKPELKKDLKEQIYPVYVAEVEGKKYYVIPLRGKGLWDAIWGYIALGQDFNTVKGIKFGHKGETPGLGAEITKKWFEEEFIGEKIQDENGVFKGISVFKGNKDPKNLDKQDNEVDAISGATLTGDGITDMIKERIEHYTPFFNKIKEQKK